MKQRIRSWFVRKEAGTFIGKFGRAQLFRRPNGAYELIGGCAEDCVEAQEWASLFMHEAVFDRSLRHPQ